MIQRSVLFPLVLVLLLFVSVSAWAILLSSPIISVPNSLTDETTGNVLTDETSGNTLVAE